MARQTTMQILAAIAVLLAGAAVAAWKVYAITQDPRVALLLPEGGAEWIRTPSDGLLLHNDEDVTGAFRVEFTIDRVPERAVLRVRPFRFVSVYLDGEPIGQTSDDFTQWKRTYEFDLAQSPRFTAGKHELFFSVINQTGPPALLAYCDAIGLRTGPDWEFKRYGYVDWFPVALADAPVDNPIGEALPRSDEKLFDLMRIFAPVFLFVALWTFLYHRRPAPLLWLDRITPTASGIRWGLLIAWAVLCANNIAKLPYGFGFDTPQHMEYMEFLLRKGRIPLANEGWQLFQSPLYYLVSAPLYALFEQLLSAAKAPEAVRIVPMVCGAIQIEFCYRALRRVYPDRSDLHAVGTVFGGLLPINIYQSQYVANEPMTAVFCSAAVLIALALLQRPESKWSPRTFLLLGLMVGLGLLAKVSALLMCGPLVLAIAYAGFSRELPVPKRMGGIAVALGLTFGAAILVCGWYFAYNWVHLGAPFVGGWDKSRGYVWWQEPGFRTPGQFLRFGQSLFYPFFSSVHGLWDGLYSTLWLDGYDGCAGILEEPFFNVDFMLTCTWLSLVPTAALAIGAAASLLDPVRAARDGRLFALISLGVYLLAIVMMMLEVPSYSTLKATYALGGLCCFAIVGAQGFDWMARTTLGRAAVYGSMACWALAVYASYFVL